MVDRHDRTDSQDSLSTDSVWMHALKLAAGAIIAGVAAFRCMVTIAEHRVLDVDPMLDPDTIAGLSIAGSLGLDVILLVASAAGMFAVHASGRRVRGWWWLLLLIPIPAAIVHGLDNSSQLWRLSTWVAAMAATVTAAHLAAEATIRRLMLGILLAGGGSLAARGLIQVWHEHAATVAMFERDKQAILADHGWTAGSASAQIFERRLRQPEPLGWFGLSNVYASVMGATLVMLIGLAIGSVARG